MSRQANATKAALKSMLAVRAKLPESSALLKIDWMISYPLCGGELLYFELNVIYLKLTQGF